MASHPGAKGVKMDKFEKMFLVKMKKERELALLSLYGGLVESIGHAGAELAEIKVKNDGAGWLGVLRAEFPAGMMVCFVWADDIAGVFVKAAREGKSDQLRWREERPWKE